jgi:hypothetical protein
LARLNSVASFRTKKNTHTMVDGITRLNSTSTKRKRSLTDISGVTRYDFAFFFAFYVKSCTTATEKWRSGVAVMCRHQLKPFFMSCTGIEPLGSGLCIRREFQHQLSQIARATALKAGHSLFDFECISDG